MSLFSLFDPALTLAHSTFVTLASAIQPLVGGLAVPVALVLITVAVRACLLPFALSVRRAERCKQALAPELARLRRRHAGDAARLARELQAAYRGAGVSPFAGLLPALAQAPPLFVVYRLCVLPVIAGAPNAVLAANLLGVPMTAHAPAVIAAAGLLGGPTLVVLVLLLALLAVALTSSRQVVRRIRDGAVGEVPPSQLLLARVLPFGTVAAVLVVPVAVSIYLLTSTTWTLAERAVLARL